jgi:hypothetical protein
VEHLEGGLLYSLLIFCVALHPVLIALYCVTGLDCRRLATCGCNTTAMTVTLACHRAGLTVGVLSEQTEWVADSLTPRSS